MRTNLRFSRYHKPLLKVVFPNHLNPNPHGLKNIQSCTGGGLRGPPQEIIEYEQFDQSNFFQSLLELSLTYNRTYLECWGAAAPCCSIAAYRIYYITHDNINHRIIAVFSAKSMTIFIWVIPNIYKSITRLLMRCSTFAVLVAAAAAVAYCVIPVFLDIVAWSFAIRDSLGGRTQLEKFLTNTLQQLQHNATYLQLQLQHTE